VVQRAVARSTAPYLTVNPHVFDCQDGYKDDEIGDLSPSSPSSGYSYLTALLQDSYWLGSRTISLALEAKTRILALRGLELKNEAPSQGYMDRASRAIGLL
jgi:hypothetical protein